MTISAILAILAAFLSENVRAAVSSHELKRESDGTDYLTLAPETSTSTSASLQCRRFDVNAIVFICLHGGST